MASPDTTRNTTSNCSEHGATMLEYVLLLALIAMAGTVGLIYLGTSDAGPSHAATHAAAGLSASGIPGPTVHPTAWCTSSVHTCSDKVALGQTQTVDFWSSGGAPPYSYELKGGASFAHLQGVDASAGTGKVAIAPVLCDQVGRYDLAIVVTDSGAPPVHGSLHFALTVAPGNNCT